MNCNNIIGCEQAERDPGVYNNGPTLAILKDVQRLYAEKMEHIDRTGGPNKLQSKVDLYNSWVNDLADQNTLLARTVEELEMEATNKLLLERKKNSERGVKKNCSVVCELKMVNESLVKENVSKDKEIRQLHKNVQQFEQTIMNLRSELSHSKYRPNDVCKRDASVMVGMGHIGTECGEWEPVRDITKVLQDETEQFQERIQKLELNLESSSDTICTLRKVNVTLTEEMHAMRRVCAALVEENRAVAVRAQFKDDIIREMRRQLKQAKAKLKEVSEETNVRAKDFVSGDGECPRDNSLSYDSVTIACVRAQPRRKRDVPLRDDTMTRDQLMRRNSERESVSHQSTSSYMLDDGTASDTMRACDCEHNLNGASYVNVE